MFNGAVNTNQTSADEQDLAESDRGMLQQRLSAAVEALRGSCCLRDESPELS